LIGGRRGGGGGKERENVQVKGGVNYSLRHERVITQ